MLSTRPVLVGFALAVFLAASGGALGFTSNDGTGSNDCSSPPRAPTELSGTLGAWVADNRTWNVPHEPLLEDETGNDRHGDRIASSAPNRTQIFSAADTGRSWIGTDADSTDAIWNASSDFCEWWDSQNGEFIDAQNKSGYTDKNFSVAGIYQFREEGGGDDNRHMWRNDGTNLFFHQAVFGWPEGSDSDMENFIVRTGNGASGTVDVAQATCPCGGRNNDPMFVYMGYDNSTGTLTIRTEDVSDDTDPPEIWQNFSVASSTWDTHDGDFDQMISDEVIDTGGMVWSDDHHSSEELFGYLSNPFGAPFAADFTVSCDALTCTFTDTSQVPGTTEFRNWTFGDGDVDETNSSQVTHTYDQFGTFDVTLTVTNTTGASDSTTQTVDVFLGPEFNTSAGLVDASTLLSIGVDWQKGSPTVWGRDVRDTANTDDGTLVEWNETLVHQGTNTLCPGSEKEDTAHELEFAVSKDNPGHPINGCTDTSGSSTTPRILIRDTNGGELVERVSGSDTGFPVDVGVRSLNNITTNNRNFRQLLDGATTSAKWKIEDGTDFRRAAIDRASGVDPITCFTQGPPGGPSTGTECRGESGFVLGSDGSLGAADVGLHDGTVFLLREGEESLERRTTGLGLVNSTSLHAAHHHPMRVSKTGKFVAHNNLSGSDADSLVIRHAGNGSVVAETENVFGDAGTDGLQSIAWHPRDERVYAANHTRIWAFNLTSVLGTSEGATTEDTTTDADVDEDEDPTDNPFGIDMTAAANALGVSTTDARAFYSIILILGMSSGAGFAYSRVGGQGMLTTWMALLGAVMGMLLASFLGWFPMWAVFLVFAAIAAYVVFERQSGGDG